MGYTNSPLATYTRLTNKHSGLRKHEIDTITIHCIVGQCTAKAGVDYFCNTDRQCSVNYVVGKDGSIGLNVEEKYRAWTSGGSDKNGNPIRVNGISGADNDHRAVTIEVASDTKHPYAVTDAALEALIKLCADICKRNGIKKLLWKNDKSLVGKVDQQNMTVHMWFANKACPGQYLLDRHSYIADEVNKILEGEKEDKVVLEMTKEELTALIDERIKAYGANTQVPAWAVEELATAKELGITDGSNPMGLATRLESAIMAKRAAENKKD